MIPSMKRLYKYILIYSTAILLIVSTLIVPFMTIDTDFSIYNTSWNGCSGITERSYSHGNIMPEISINNADTQIAHDALVYENLKYDESSILIIGPNSLFSNDEAIYIRGFLSKGGRILLADDFGTGNDLLEKIDATTRFSSYLLYDLAYEKNPKYGVVFEFTEHAITSNISRVLLNCATTLTVDENTVILANSSAGSWLDSNLNGLMDDFEPKGPLPILAIEKYGKGELILLSDPSILINFMQKYFENSKFKDNLLDYMSSEKKSVLIDESHRASSETYSSVVFAVIALSSMQKFGLIILIGITIFIVGMNYPIKFIKKRIYGISKLFDRFKRKESEEKPGSAIDIIMTRHPDWDRNLLLEFYRELNTEGWEKS